MGQVAAAAELSKGTLYLYFKNKGDLFLAMSGRMLCRIVEAFEQQVCQPGDGLEILRCMLTVYVDYAMAAPEHFRAVVSWISSGYRADTTTVSFAQHRALVQRLHDAIVRCVDRGIRDGSMRSDLEPTPVAAQVWGGVFGAVQIAINSEELNRRFPQPVDPSEYVSGFIDLLTSGLRRSGGPDQADQCETK